MENIPYPGHMSFLEGREQVKDELRAGRPSTSKTDNNVERVRSLVRSDRRLTLRMISSELNLNRFAVHQILTQDLDMRKVCAKTVQRTSRLSRRPIGEMCVLIFCTALRGSHNSSAALSQVMNHGFWSTTPRLNANVGSGTLQIPPRTKKARMSKSKIKSVLICFFDSQEIVHKEFVPTGQTVNQTFYREVLVRLGKRVARVRPGIARTWMLQHNNAPCHKAVSFNEFLAEKSIPVVPQPPLFTGSQSL